MCNDNNIISEIQNKYLYMEFSKDDINNLIVKNKLKKQNDILIFFSEYIKNILKGKIKYKISIEKIVNNFIETNIETSNDTSNNINELKKLEIFFRDPQNDNLINTTIQIISSNIKIKAIVENLLSYNKVSKIRDEFILSLIDTYCISNDIEIIEDESYKESADSISQYFFNDLRNCIELTEEEKYDLLVRIKNGEENLKPLFSECYLRLVVNIAKTIHNSYHDYRCDFLDMVDEGTIGLMHALDKFDISKGYKFSTYATWWIRQKITRSIINKYQIVRIPLHSTEKLRQIEKAKNILENEGKQGNIKELSEKTGLSTETIKTLVLAPKQLDSLDRLVGEDEDTTIGDFIPSDENIENDYFDNIAYKELLNALKQSLIDEIITENEYLVITKKLGIYGKESTYQGIADEFGFTKQWAEQTFKHGLKKLRKSKHIKNAATYYDDIHERVLKKGRKV